MDKRLKHIFWAGHLGAILRDYKKGFTDKPLDAGQVDELTEIIRQKLNLVEGNMTLEEYCAWEQKSLAMKPEN